MKNKPETIIKFCLPEKESFESTNDFMTDLVSASTETDSDQDKWGGFLGEPYLKDALWNKFNENDYQKYEHPDEGVVSAIQETAKPVAHNAQKELSNPNSALKIFVYPWFPSEKMDAFEGVLGTTYWTGSFHLYIDFQDFSNSSLKKTVAHEYNHSIRLNHFSPFEQTMLEAIIMEGLAEVFREEVVGGNPAPWAKALTKNEVKEALDQLKDDFNTKTENDELFQDIFYGGDKFKQWTGYSCGYRIVTSYRSDNPNISWENLIKKNPEKILRGSRFK